MRKLLLTSILLIISIVSFSQQNVLVIDYNNNFSSDRQNNASQIYNRLLATQTSVTRVAAIPATINPATYQQVWIFGNMGATTAANLNPIVNYMNAGGAVYVQSEVSCCNNEAAFVDALINATVIAGGSITHNVTQGPYYQTVSNTPCTQLTTYGAAERPFLGTPAANVLFQLNNVCGNTRVGDVVAVQFRNCDMISGQGALISAGDFNIFPQSGACGTVGILGTPNRLPLIDMIANLLPNLLNCNTSTQPTFDIRDTVVCGGPLTYTSPLISPGYNYLWSNNATTTTTTINTSGKHWLRIEISPGCFITDTFNITYNGSTAVTVNDTTICAGQTVTLTATPATSGGTYSWTPGGATTPSITVTPGTTTNYIVTYTLGGCTGTDTGTVTVNPIPTVNVNNTTICPGQSATLTATPSIGGGTYSWSPGGMTTQTINVTPGTTTTYTVTYTLNGCTGTGSGTVTISPAPTLTVNNATICAGQQASITATPSVTGGTYSWTPGGATTQTINVSPANTTTYVVTYNLNGCIATDSGIVTVNPVPTPGFTFTSQCQGTAINFTNTSAIASGTMSYTWDFGDNSPTSSNVNPSHNYANCGTYTVKLITTSNSGCIDSISQNVQVYCLPTANFNFTSVCLGDQTCFTDSSFVNNSNISSWQWLFGDGSPANTTGNPCHTYIAANQTPGYSVTLVVTTAQGCTGNITKNVPVYVVPTASFSVSNECLNNAVTVTDNSVNAVNYNWAFGDGNTSNTTGNQSHNYNAPGTYNIQLILTSGTCTDTFTAPVTVHPMPTADFNFTNVCDGLVMPLTDNSNISAGNITQWDWNYGDGTPNGNTQNSTHSYTNCGPYNVTLTVTSDSGCVDVITKPVEVYPLPQANYTATETCLGVAAQFTDLSTVNCGTTSGSVTNWSWTFGDSSPNQGAQNPSHTYSSSGNYNSQLVVTSSNGCKDSVVVTVNVYDNPDISFSVDKESGCTPVCVNFINNSNNPIGTTTYTWSLGDGTNTSGSNPSHCYSNNSLSAKTFDVTVGATTNYGSRQCSSSLTQNAMVTVYPLPIAEFDFSPINPNVLNPSVDFMNMSQGGSVWNWNFGDGGTSSNQNPSHLYKDSGNYVIWLNIENSYGCKDSISKTIRVEPDFMLYIPNTFTPDGDKNNNYFSVKGYGYKELTMLIFDRWGEIVYEGHQMDSKWDGSIKGGAIGKTDVYTYKIEVKDLKGESHTYIGKVTLLK